MCVWWLKPTWFLVALHLNDLFRILDICSKLNCHAKKNCYIMPEMFKLLISISFNRILAHAKGGPRSRVCARKNSKSPSPFNPPQKCSPPRRGGNFFLHVLIKVLAISDNSDHFSFFPPPKKSKPPPGGRCGSPNFFSRHFSSSFTLKSAQNIF